MHMLMRIKVEEIVTRSSPWGGILLVVTLYFCCSR